MYDHMGELRYMVGETVTLSLFSFEPKYRFWALAQMGIKRYALSKIPGLIFWKLLGTGAGQGFSIKPDLSSYGILCVWEHDGFADRFLRESAIMLDYKAHASEGWHMKLKTVKSHGAWDGSNPFMFNNALVDRPGPVAVLTRATISPLKVIRFWEHVPDTSRLLDSANGLIASIGIGEAPFFRQATFSIWESEEAMTDFAYRSDHLEVVRKTRKEKWYSEDLFARFAIISCFGTRKGKNPLQGYV